MCVPASRACNSYPLFVGTMFFDMTAPSPNQRQNVRFSFGLGTGSIRLYQESNTFGTNEIGKNASAAFAPNISALRETMVSSSTTGKASVNLTVITMRVAPYWYQDPNNNTVGLVYDIYQELKSFMASNYNITLRVTLVGDGLSALHFIAYGCVAVRSSTTSMRKALCTRACAATNADELQGSQLPNGSWNGMIGALLTQQADLAIGPLIASAEQEQLVQFSSTFLSVPITLLRKACAVLLTAGSSRACATPRLMQVYDTPAWYSSLLYVYAVTFDWLLWVSDFC